MLWARKVCLALAVLCFAPVAFASPDSAERESSASPAGDRSRSRARARKRARRRRAHRRRRASRSVGYPWRGQLRRGVKVEPSRHLRYTGAYERQGNFYGTSEMAQLLERAARRVARRLPGAKLSIGELSRSEGGEIGGHHSHENGRDVDLAFYMTSRGGRPYPPFGFAEFDGAGHGKRPNQNLRFDDARNWELVARLVADPDARVQHIFVSNPIRRRLLREGRARGAPARVLRRAARVMRQPNHGHPHRNHFHVRIYCAPADRPTCEDRAPFWPWYPRCRVATTAGEPENASPERRIRASASLGTGLPDVRS